MHSVCILLSTIVLNSGTETKKYGVSLFALPQHTSQGTLPEKLTKIHWLRYDNTIRSLDTVKILQLVKLTYILSDCQPAVIPTNTRNMAPDLSHNKGNHVQLTNLSL